jgi:hypothetical protein
MLDVAAPVETVADTGDGTAVRYAGLDRDHPQGTFRAQIREA